MKSFKSFINENKNLEKIFQDANIFGTLNIIKNRKVKIESNNEKSLKKFDELINMADSLIKTYYDKDKNLIIDLSKISVEDYFSALELVSTKYK